MSPRPPHRFYYAGHIDAQNPPQTLNLSETETNHMLRVLRLRPGTLIDIFDAGGGAWSAEVISADARQPAAVRLLAPIMQDETDSPSIHLAVSLLKRRAMDWMLEKLSELGVETLQPLQTARTVIQPDSSADPDTPERWDRILLAAAKQCGRNRPLTTLPPMPVIDWLGRSRPPAHAAFAHFEADAQPFGEWLRERADVNLPVWIAIGPEGGWTPDEVDAFSLAAFSPVLLGDLTLRAETAAIAVAAASRFLIR